MSEVFLWHGEPIKDIEAWCKKRGEKLLRYRAIRKVPNHVTGKIVKEVQTGRIPESFAYNLRYTDGWNYKFYEDNKEASAK